MTEGRSGFKNRTLFLFPDTNVFIQCRLLNEVDWLPWIDYEEVHLIVCQPVQREMDKHKNRGGDRVAKRARRTCSMFRQIILSEKDYEVIQQAGPRVVLSLDASISPSERRPLSPDYSNTDDRLVGCVQAYREKNEDLDVRLLTHDIGPMMTAKNMQLPTVVVPDGWLLPPEPNKTEKELATLRREIERLKDSEPRFRTRFLDAEEIEIRTIEVEYIIYEPLSEDDLAVVVGSLTAQFPIATDFGHRQPLERVGVFGWKDAYVPAKDEEITVYEAREYPSWLEGCKSIFSKLHHVLQRQARPVVFRFGAMNEGIRPGKNVLVVISSKGGFRIRPPQMEEEYDHGGGDVSAQLPEPPKPPQGAWKSTSALRLIGRFGEEFLAPNFLQDRLPTVPDGLLARMDSRRDPDSFYYKPESPSEPVQSFMLECEQWRHGTAEEVFYGEIYVDRNEDEISGVLECEIHAENLSTPIKDRTPVRIKVRRVSVLEYAVDLVNKLTVSIREAE